MLNKFDTLVAFFLTVIISAFIGGIVLAFYNENEYYLIMSIVAFVLLYAG